MDTKKVPVVCDPDGFCKPVTPKPVDATPPHPQCVITVTYPKGSPEQPTIAMDHGACDNPELALAILITALLRSAQP